MVQGQLPPDGVAIYGQYLGSQQARPDVRVGDSKDLGGKVSITGWGATGTKISIPANLIRAKFAQPTTVTVSVIPQGASAPASKTITVTAAPAAK